MRANVKTSETQEITEAGGVEKLWEKLARTYATLGALCLACGQFVAVGESWGLRPGHARRCLRYHSRFIFARFPPNVNKHSAQCAATSVLSSPSSAYIYSRHANRLHVHCIHVSTSRIVARRTSVWVAMHGIIAACLCAKARFIPSLLCARAFLFERFITAVQGVFELTGFTAES